MNFLSANHTWQLAQRRSWKPALSCTRFSSLALLAMIVIFSSGCQRWPGTQAMRQYQVESDRMLTEFRSQKKRAEELEQRNHQLEQRLAESEKQVARIQSRSSGSRLANRNTSIGSANDASEIASDSNSSRNATLRKSRNGLPEATPGTPGQLTGTGTLDRRDLRGDTSRSDQWRPISGR